jgi:hypothetical protein
VKGRTLPRCLQGKQHDEVGLYICPSDPWRLRWLPGSNSPRPKFVICHVYEVLNVYLMELSNPCCMVLRAADALLNTRVPPERCRLLVNFLDSSYLCLWMDSRFQAGST